MTCTTVKTHGKAYDGGERTIQVNNHECIFFFIGFTIQKKSRQEGATSHTLDVRSLYHFVLALPYIKDALFAGPI